MDVDIIRESFDVTSEAELIEHKKPNVKPSLLRRITSTFETGTVQGSVYTLCLTAIGPENMLTCALLRINGLLLGTFFVVSVAFVSRHTMNILVKAADKFKIYDYAHLVKHLFDENYSNALEASIILYEVGVLIGLQVMLGDIMPEVLDVLGFNLSQSFAAKFSMIFLNLVLMTPLGLFRHLTSLQYVSFCGILGILYITLVTIFEFQYFYSDHGLKGIRYVTFSGDLLITIPLCLLLYFGHTNICKIAGELENTNEAKMYRVTLIATVSLQILNFLFAIFGYLSSLENTPEVFILRDPVVSLGSDFAMFFGRVTICVTLIAAAPINLNPVRATVINLVFRGDDSFKV